MLLRAAVLNGDADRLRQLADKGYNINARNVDGDTLAHLAVFFQLMSMIKPLKEVGADLDKKNNSGFKPLTISIGLLNLGMTKELVANGARVDDNDLVLAMAMQSDDTLVFLENSKSRKSERIIRPEAFQHTVGIGPVEKEQVTSELGRLFLKEMERRLASIPTRVRKGTYLANL